jgi:hypothetical protein
MYLVMQLAQQIILTTNAVVWIRVARWYIFKPKLPIWVHFGGPLNRKCWHILWTFGLYYGHFVYFIAVWHTLWSLDICISTCFAMLYQVKSGKYFLIKKPFSSLSCSFKEPIRIHIHGILQKCCSLSIKFANQLATYVDT